MAPESMFGDLLSLKQESGASENPTGSNCIECQKACKMLLFWHPPFVDKNP